jgi:hypothetical protein
MTTEHDAPRGSGDFFWFLGWVGLVSGLLLWLLGRASGPSPGSEWSVLEIAAPIVAVLGALALLLGGALRSRRR